MLGDHNRSVRLFVDVDGCLTDLLSRLNETKKVALVDDIAGRASEVRAVHQDQGATAPGKTEPGIVFIVERFENAAEVAAGGDVDFDKDALQARENLLAKIWRSISESSCVVMSIQQHPYSIADPSLQVATVGLPEFPTSAPDRKRRDQVSPSLLAHLLDTFGSEPTARDWLSSECGALNNRTPLEVIRAEGNELEVERVLTCIDYGMFA